MMGVHHAVTGAAAWLALTSTLEHIPALGLVPMEPGQVALGAVITAGAALLPDADHPSATIAHSVPWVGKAVTGAINDLSGGHRHGTHSGLSAIIVSVLAFAAMNLGWTDTTQGSVYFWVAAVGGAALMAFAMKVLRVVRTWFVAWATGAGISALISVFAPHEWAWLPLAVAVGWVVHMAGDFLTTGGLPLLWPKNPKPPVSWHDKPFRLRFWSRGGYFAFPILGNAGSWREWLLCLPLWVYVAWGVGVSTYAALPGITLS